MLRAIKFTGAVALVLAVTGFAQADETKGTIKTVDTGRHEIVIKGTLKDTVYELKKDANVWLDGHRSKLAELKADDRAVVIYEKRGDHYMASTVRALRNTKEATGTISEIVAEKNEVVLKGLVKNTTYEMSKGATFWVEGKQVKMNDLRAGDEVIVTYQERGEHLMAADVTVTKRK